MEGKIPIHPFYHFLAVAISLPALFGCDQGIEPPETPLQQQVEVAPPQKHVGAEAKKFLQLQAEAEVPGKQYKYAYVLSISPEDPTDLALAKDYFTKEAEEGHLEACFRLGVMLSQGKLDGTPDIPAAIKWLERAAQDGHSGAQYLLGRLSLQEEGVETNPRKAVAWLQLAAHQSHPAAQYLLARLYETGHGVGLDLEEAFRWYMLAARAGDPGAQFKVGSMLKGGIGTTQDAGAARIWLARAANLGMLVEPMPASATTQENEAPVPGPPPSPSPEPTSPDEPPPPTRGLAEATGPNGESAASVVTHVSEPEQSSATQESLPSDETVENSASFIGPRQPGSSPDSMGLSRTLVSGSTSSLNSITEEEPTIVSEELEPKEIVVVDAPPQSLHRKAIDLLQPPAEQTPQPARAVAYLQKAADKGYTPSQLRLADTYYDGVLGEPDYRQAFLWYNLAANSQNPSAQFKVGSMYLEGKGVDKDTTKAKEWFVLSAKQGHAQAQELLNSLPVGNDSSPASPTLLRHEERPSETPATPVSEDSSTTQPVPQPVPLLTAEQWLEKGIDIYTAGDDLPVAQYKKAYQYFVRAAKGNHQDAWYYIGRMLDYGQGFPASSDKAFKYYQASAVGGNIRAQYNLGYFYETGQGCPENPIESYAWYALAAENGDGNAAQIRLELENTMTATQQELAKQRLEVIKDYVARYQQQVPPK